jgi:hypothetical protein
MTRIVVVGEPYPDTNPGYRGLDRIPSLVDESLGLRHPLNEALLAFISLPEGSSHALALAFEVVRQYRHLRRHFEVLEAVKATSQPAHPGRFLGTDVVLEGGDHSLLAKVLLSNLTTDAASSSRSALGRTFTASLNAYQLFAVAADAERFRDAALAIGPWEAPEIGWEIVDIWAPTPEASILDRR